MTSRSSVVGWEYHLELYVTLTFFMATVQRGVRCNNISCKRYFKQAVVLKHNKPRPRVAYCSIERFLGIDPKLNQVVPWSLRTFPENFMQIGPAVSRNLANKERKKERKKERYTYKQTKKSIENNTPFPDVSGTVKIGL